MALQLELFTLLMDTLMPLAVVDPDVLRLKQYVQLLLPPFKLQAYPPKYKEKDPPYELIPKDSPAVALQLELLTMLMDTLTPLTVVNPDTLRLTK